MLRMRPTEITLTPADINESSKRIAARRRAHGKAKIRRGPERSRDEAITKLGRIPRFQPPLTAEHISDSEETEPARTLDVPKILLTSAPTGEQVHAPSELNSSGSEESEVLTFTSQRIPSQSGMALQRLPESSSNTAEIPQLHLDGQFDGAVASSLAPSTLLAHRPALPRSPLFQSQTMSSPTFPGSATSSHHRQMHMRQQFSDGSISYNLVDADAAPIFESSRSTPNFYPDAFSRAPNFSRPMSLTQSPMDDCFTQSIAQRVAPVMPSSISSERTSSGDSSSATEAAIDDSPSPLDFISQQAAGYRSRVSSANRTTNHGRVAEVMRRIDLLGGRRSSGAEPSHGAEEFSISLSATNSTLGSESADKEVSYSHTVSRPTTRDGSLSLLEPESLHLPTMRHRRSFLHAIRLPEPEDRDRFSRSRHGDLSSSRRVTPAGQHSGQAILHSPISGSSSRSWSGMTSSPSPQRRFRSGNFPINAIREEASPPAHVSRRPIEPASDPIILPRTRPTSTPRDLYERNNDFLARLASTERLDMELGRQQRPTPPPAIGQGRPHTSGNNSLPRTRSRPLPQWQRNQENSEELAMSGLQDEMRTMRIRDENDAVGRGGVMDDTPPREGRLERYLRD